ncbi:MAG: hypothetical protein KGN76_02630 [Acidobacteriota bacterium]|nr:hypothetical protein [Acidobacteriota bacterium]
MRRTVLLLSAVVLLAVSSPSYAQTSSPTASSALDGPVQWHGPGAEPFIQLPIQDWTIGNLFIAMSRAAHVP